MAKLQLRHCYHSGDLVLAPEYGIAQLDDLLYPFIASVYCCENCGNETIYRILIKINNLNTWMELCPPCRFAKIYDFIFPIFATRQISANHIVRDVSNIIIKKYISILSN